MADFDFGDGLRKVFLAGVGALATTVEKSQEIVDDLVKKGELTVERARPSTPNSSTRSRRSRNPLKPRLQRKPRKPNLKPKPSNVQSFTSPSARRITFRRRFVIRNLRNMRTAVCGT